MSPTRVIPPTSSPSGTLVACLPGGGIAPEYFETQIGDEPSLADALAEHGHAVATLALPGTCGVPHAGDGGLADAAVELAERVERARASASAERVVVLGHSLGGALALLIQARASRVGAPLAGLVVLGYTPRWSSTPHLSLPSAAAGQEKIRSVVRTHLAQTAPELWSHDPVRFPFHAGFALGDQPEQEALRAAAELEIGVPRGLAEDYGVVPLALPAASDIVGPVLLIGGDIDASDDLAADAALFTSAEVSVVRLAGSAHWHAIGAQRADLRRAVVEWVDAVTR